MLPVEWEPVARWLANNLFAYFLLQSLFPLFKFLIFLFLVCLPFIEQYYLTKT